MRGDAEKKKRHELIKDIIRSKPIQSQQELVNEIRSHQLQVTQTTISRDLEELRVGKWQGSYTIPAHLEQSPAWHQTIRQHLRKVSCVGEHLVILTIAPGTYGVVESTVNSLHLPQCVGVSGGDQSAWIACANKADQVYIWELFKKILLPHDS